MKSIRLSIPLLAFVIVSSLCRPLTAPAADSAGFNPFSVSITAESPDETPIGAVISCPVAKCKGEEATTAEGYPKWLECDGQAVNATRYPELSALIGASVPDLRGLFLRGLGGKSALLGQKQSEGVYVPRINVTINGIGTGKATAEHTTCESSICMGADHGEMSVLVPGGSYTSSVNFDTGGNSETRPANMAVRYLIRAAK